MYLNGVIAQKIDSALITNRAATGLGCYFHVWFIKSELQLKILFIVDECVDYLLK